MTRVLVVGEPLVELLEGPLGTSVRGFGGDAVNTAVYLAREAPEMRVSLASAVGDDSSSDDLVALCLAEAVDVSCLLRVPGAEIGRYRVTVDGTGERALAYERSHSPFGAALDGDDVLPHPSEVDLLYFSGITMAVLHELGRHALCAYAMEVRHRGGRIAYDPNHRPALWNTPSEARGWLSRAVSVADFVLASTEDGRALTGLTGAAEIAVRLREEGTAEVVVTDGPRPCSIFHDDRMEEVAVSFITDVVDTTAAGDAFNAGYLAGRLRGLDPVASAAVGHRLAARVVGHRGAIVPAEGPSELEVTYSETD
ncbi:MAG: sugar kinase [Actinomycetota bacterium]